MKGLLFVFYALLVAILIISYKKNSFVFWGLLIIILIFIYAIVKIVRSSIKGNYFLNKGDAKKAINIYSELITSPFKSNKAMGLANRGIVYLKTKKYNFALYDFVESAGIAIIPLLNIAQIGIIYCEFKEYDRALKYFLRVIELKPKSSIAYSNLGWFYSHTKEYDKAIKSLNKSMTLRELRGNSVILANTYSNLGFIYGASIVL